MKREEIIKLFAKSIRKILEGAALDYEQVQEIRMRVQNPFLIIYKEKEYFLEESGALTDQKRQAHVVTAEEVAETMEYIAGYSLFAYEDEIRQGYLTVQGGHRVGVAGKLITEGDKVKGVKYISYINVRISHEIKGCASQVLPYLVDGKTIYHTLLISAPRCGKTTMLRDIVRQVSDGFGKFPGNTVGVVDERSEIGGSYMGIPQNDVGIRTDVLDCCPKAEGMMMLVRSMSPAIIAVDELGDYSDIHAIESVIHCGCRLLATVHGNSIDDIKRKPLLQKLMNDHTFERYVLLQNQRKTGQVKAIFDERGTCLYRDRCVVC